MTRYLGIKTAPAVRGQRCQGRICGRVMSEGEPFTLVAHERRALAQPHARDARAHLCDDCCARLGDRLVTDVVPGARVPLPTQIRGKAIEPW